MPQTSKYPLDKNTQQEMFRTFWQSISFLSTADDASVFLSDFLSDTEELMLAKRFAIAVLLHRGRRPKDIKTLLHVSNSATGAVSAWLKNANPKTIETLERIIQKSNWDKFIDTLDAMFDSLPPRYGTNWSRKGKEKFKALQARESRKPL